MDAEERSDRNAVIETVVKKTIIIKLNSGRHGLTRQKVVVPCGLQVVVLDIVILLYA